MSRSGFYIILVLLGAILVMIALEWYSAERLKLDLERAEAEQQWAAAEYQASTQEYPHGH